MAEVEKVVIQGKTVDSKEEVMVASSLGKFGHTYVYQQPINGGNMVAGGFTLDFLVTSSVPLPTPLEVQSEHWHSGAQSDRDTLKKLFLTANLKGYAELQEIWAEQLIDQNACDQEILKMFGRMR